MTKYFIFPMRQNKKMSAGEVSIPHYFLLMFIMEPGNGHFDFWSCKLNRKEYQNIDSKIWKKLRVELTTSRNYDVGIFISLFFSVNNTTVHAKDEHSKT